MLGDAQLHLRKEILFFKDMLNLYDEAANAMYSDSQVTFATTVPSFTVSLGTTKLEILFRRGILFLKVNKFLNIAFL